jgi:hypothetical protein
VQALSGDDELEPAMLDPDLDKRLSHVAEDLRRLAVLDAHRKAFGAIGHHHQLRPLARPGDVAAFERAHAIRLPPEYRAFLLRVGNGGVGPFYGIHPLGQDTDGPWKTEPFAAVGRLGSPFPHRAPWNLSEEELTALAPDDEEDEDNEPIELEREYFAPIDGAFPIADEGCGMCTVLVVSGPEAGTVWRDARADFDGIRPWGSGGAVHEGCFTFATFLPSGEARRANAEAARLRLSFLDWYELWLAQALRHFVS